MGSRKGMCVALVAVLLAGEAALAQFETAEEASGTVKLVAKGAPELRMFGRGVTPRLTKMFEGASADHRLELEYGPNAGPLLPRNAPKHRLLRATMLDKDGHKDGPETFGGYLPRQTVRWRNGKKHGTETVYKIQGENCFGKVAEKQWVDGVLQGEARTFYASTRYAHKRFLETPVQSVTPYVDGVIQGEAKTYSRDGKLRRITRYRSGRRHGEMVDYWPDGKTTKRVAPFDDGKVRGVVREYHRDGTIRKEAPYRDDLRHGVERRYTAKGEVREEVRWENDERIEDADE